MHINKLNEQIEAQNVFIKRVESEKLELGAIVAELHKDKEQLHIDLEDASAYMQELEEKVFNAHKKSLDLLV